MKVLRPHRAGACSQALLLALCLLPGLVMACTARQNSSAQYSGALMPDEPADQLALPFSLGSGSWGGVTGCSPLQSVQIRIDPALQGLTYVRDVMIDGISYSAYSLHSASPLLAFRHVWFNAAFSPQGTPLQNGRSVTVNARTDDRGEIAMGLQVAVLGRGGTMTGHVAGDIGVVESTVLFPGTQTVSHRKGINLMITPYSCEVRGAVGGDVLAPVVQTQLSFPGQTAGEKPLDAQVFCAYPGMTAVMRLDDARNPANTGSILAPAAGTTAGGVGLQVLRGGVPVQFGQEWDTVAGFSWTDLDLSARYIRLNEDISPGELHGQAILTATHR
ncbi:hypothetical protein [Stenotrophomonas sp. B1-1]|uniref:fimbrial protein n=1 Tax=Stenotrophomonas sp. B1-1 TaxID=2710648 RepID=UPI0013DB1021|nr:hypothetical protein [Stenotrophomonas sp. B1-1]